MRQSGDTLIRHTWDPIILWIEVQTMHKLRNKLNDELDDRINPSGMWRPYSNLGFALLDDIRNKLRVIT